MMSDEHLYCKTDEMSDVLIFVDATNLGSELEVETEYEETPFTTQSSSLSIEDGLNIEHDVDDIGALYDSLKSPNLPIEDSLVIRQSDNCSGTSDDDSIELPPFTGKSPNLSNKDQLIKKHDESSNATSDDDSVEPQPPVKSPIMTIKDNLDAKLDVNGTSDDDSIQSLPLTMQLSNLPIEDELDIGHDGGGIETSDDGSLESPPLSTKSLNLLIEDEFDIRHDADGNGTSGDDDIELPLLTVKSPNLPIEELEISHSENDNITSDNYSRELLPFTAKSCSLPIKDGMDIMHDEGNNRISENVNTESPSLSTKFFNLSNEDSSDMRYDERGNATSDDVCIVSQPLIVKSSDLGIEDGLHVRQDEASNQTPDNDKKESPESPPLTMVRDPSMVRDEEGLHIRQDETGNGIPDDDRLESPESPPLTMELSMVREEDGLHVRQEEAGNRTPDDDKKESPESPPLTMELSNLPIEDGLDIRHDGGGNEISDDDSLQSSPHSIKSPDLPIEDELNIRRNGNGTSGDENIELLLPAEKSPGFPFEERLDVRHNESDNRNSGNDNIELPPFTGKSSSLTIGLDIVHDEGGNGISENDNVESQTLSSKSLIFPNEDWLDVRHDKGGNASSDDDYVEHQPLTVKSHNLSIEDGVGNRQGEVGNGTLDDDSIDSPPFNIKSPSPLAEDGLDIRHDGGGNETSDDENLEPPKKKRKVIDSSNIISPVKVNTDSENSGDKSSYDGSNYLFLKEDKFEDFTEMEYDNTADNLNSGQSGIMEFDILDEFESNDNDDDRYSDCESDISLDELDEMLEASLQNPRNTKKEVQHVDIGDIDDYEHEEKEKIVLKVRGRDHFDVLPEGWVEVTHNSGMPIYLHKATRVCCVSKPYFLGPGSTRKHEIPVSAIPCLQYLKEIEKEKIQAQELKERADSDKFPPAKLECVKETKESGSLDFMAVREYCKKRFEFQTITVKRFKTWAGRRRHQKQLRTQQRPSLPDNTKLITCPLPTISDRTNMAGSIAKKEFIMNPSGKSPICILHEYVQHTLRVQPKYIFKELENASTPYGAVVLIGGMEYGSGYGSSKKQAKSEAAKSALDVLIPKMKMFPPEDPTSEEHQDVEFFDQVRVEDPRVSELSIKAGQPYPFQILLECLKRNYGMGDTEVDITMRNLKHQKNEYIMKVGKHSVSVICKNKRDGKHRASQAILQLLHPHITSWGSLLRMYGKGSCKTLKEKKEEEQRITELQSQACANKPNLSILNKLKIEMLKYREKMKMKKPIGKLIPEQMELSTSDSNLKNVEL